MNDVAKFERRSKVLQTLSEGRECDAPAPGYVGRCCRCLRRLGGALFGTLRPSSARPLALLLCSASLGVAGGAGALGPTLRLGTSSEICGKGPKADACQNGRSILQRDAGRKQRCLRPQQAKQISESPSHKRKARLTPGFPRFKS